MRIVVFRPCNIFLGSSTTSPVTVDNLRVLFHPLYIEKMHEIHPGQHDTSGPSAQYPALVPADKHVHSISMTSVGPGATLHIPPMPRPPPHLQMRQRPRQPNTVVARFPGSVNVLTGAQPPQSQHMSLGQLGSGFQAPAGTLSLSTAITMPPSQSVAPSNSSPMSGLVHLVSEAKARASLSDALSMSMDGSQEGNADGGDVRSANSWARTASSTSLSPLHSPLGTEQSLSNCSSIDSGACGTHNDSGLIRPSQQRERSHDVIRRVGGENTSFEEFPTPSLDNSQVISDAIASANGKRQRVQSLTQATNHARPQSPRSAEPKISNSNVRVDGPNQCAQKLGLLFLVCALLFDFGPHSCVIYGRHVVRFTVDDCI